MSSRFSSCLVLIGLCSTGVPGAHAGVVSGFLAEIRPNQSQFAIRNISDGNDIVQVIMQLGDNTIFETSIYQIEAMTGQISVMHDFSITPGPDGFAALSDSAAPLSLVGTLSTAIVDGTSPPRSTSRGSMRAMLGASSLAMSTKAMARLLPAVT